jgi:DNA-binding Lrp family transcriptional regulator
MVSLNRIGYRILQELSIQARVKRKDIAKRVHISPQLVSYTIAKLEEQTYIRTYTANIDPARFDLITIFVFFSYTNFEKETISSIKEYLQNDDYVTYLESLSHGADMLVEYCVPNLSFFNKRHAKFTERFQGAIEVLSILPVIVKHQFPRMYLSDDASQPVENIYSGDREPASLMPAERTVLAQLWTDPKVSAQELAKRCQLNVRTVLRMLQRFLDEQIVRTFSIVPDYQMIGIEAAIIFIHTKTMTHGQVQRLLSYARMTPEIVSVTKVIGQYGIMVKIESLHGYRKPLDDLRQTVHFSDYYLYDVREVLKCTYVPYSVLHSD